MMLTGFVVITVRTIFVGPSPSAIPLPPTQPQGYLTVRAHLPCFHGRARYLGAGTPVPVPPSPLALPVVSATAVQGPARPEANAPEPGGTRERRRPPPPACLLAPVPEAALPSPRPHSLGAEPVVLLLLQQAQLLPAGGLGGKARNGVSGHRRRGPAEGDGGPA